MSVERGWGGGGAGKLPALEALGKGKKKGGGARKVKVFFPPAKGFYRAAEVSTTEGRRGENMYLFILLFTVYLIVALTRRECASAAGLRFRFFLRSLQNGCVYLFFLV